MNLKQSWYAVMPDLRVIYVGFNDKKPTGTSVIAHATHVINERGLHRLQDAMTKAQRLAHKTVAGNATVLDANIRAFYAAESNGHNKPTGE